MRLAGPSLALLVALPAAGSEPCLPADELVVAGLGTPADELVRLADLAPGALVPASGMIRRGAVTTRARCAGGAALPWSAAAGDASSSGGPLAAVPLRLRSVFRASSPGGGNDGTLWEGRGLSTLASAGVRGRVGPVAFQVAPELAWMQNDFFEIVPTGAPGRGAFATPWYGRGIDLPQRPGAGPLARLAPGQSYVEVTGLGVAAGVSTENRWWGPGQRSALLLSNTAEGFPHVYVGTARPVETAAGAVEALILWGRLERTRWFAERGDRAFTGLALTWQPRWIPGLYLGAGRTYVESWRSLRDDYLLSTLEVFVKGLLPGGDNPDDNQLAALWGRWVFPESGVEVYGEFALEDFSAPDKLVREPERTNAWTLGLQKRFGTGPRWTRLSFEMTTTRSTIPPGHGTFFYTHGGNLGYTHRGQLLGASVGPGGELQRVAVDVFGARGRLGGFLERQRRNEDVFWAEIVTPERRYDHDTELVAGVRQVLIRGGLELSWELAGGYRWSRDFVESEPVLRAELALSVPLGR